MLQDMEEISKTAGVSERGRATRHLSAEEPVLLDIESRARGFRDNRAFLRWCRARDIPVLSDGGKMRWVVPAEINRVLARMRVEAELLQGSRTHECSDEVSEALKKKMGGKL